MESEKGFIIITNKLWCEFCSTGNLNEVNVWIKRNSFKAVPINSPIFFLEKGTRLVKGFGTLKCFEVNTIKNTWEKYKLSNGASSYTSFLNILNLPNNDIITNEKTIGNLIVKNVIWNSNMITIDNIGVPFHKAIVSGKTINKEEAAKIINTLK
ncbi:hypothetical protein [Bacillus cereus]|uniref:hypothetical protein n=1 Tax=Bacillus cereus TaxID=1396 RepID=UPI002B245DDA|nr:hypothetical protein [Bacillus cereus]MEB2584704.1 hypothetical protein [Bacillus cereus]MEB2612183.1 hypothetical protein [Bacillus cereus]